MSEETQHQAPSLTVVGLGHNRSGKTTLLAALLQGVRGLPGASEEWSRRLSPWELDRLAGGIAFSSASATDKGALPTVEPRQELFRLATRQIVYTDTPGRRGWMKGVARGIGCADAAVLVVSAPESVEAQTLEHLQLAQALGCSKIIVFLNKCDRVSDPEWLDLAEREVREALYLCGFEGDEVRLIRGAAERALAGDPAWQSGIRELMAALEEELVLPQLDPDGPCLLYVDRPSRRSHGRGRLLVTGRLRRGRLAVGELVRLVGVGVATRGVVESLELFGRRIEVAQAGDELGVMLIGSDRRIGRWHLRRGQSLLSAGPPSLARQLVVELEAFEPAAGGRSTPLGEGHEVTCLFGAVILSGWLRFEGAHPVEPGSIGRAHVHLRSEAYFEPGMTFALADGHQPRGGQESGTAQRYGLVGRGRILAVDHCGGEDR